MAAFIKKYWKIVLIILMSVALVIAIYKIIRLQEAVDKSNIAIELLYKRIEDNNRIYEKNQEIIAKLDSSLKNQKVIVVTTKEFYERIKKSPVNANISDRELLNKLKELESKYPKK